MTHDPNLLGFVLERIMADIKEAQYYLQYVEDKLEADDKKIEAKDFYNAQIKLARQKGRTTLESILKKERSNLPKHAEGDERQELENEYLRYTVQIETLTKAERYVLHALSRQDMEGEVRAWL